LGLGQLVDESDNNAIEPTIGDPSLCRDNFFHLTDGPVEETEFPMLGSIGLYTVSDAPSKMEEFQTMFTCTLVLLAREGAACAPANAASHDLTLFLQAVAVDKNLTRKDVISWF
jgi:hypothetical protein